ncbi:tail protein X [Erythrobacter sp. EC-HK427]|uniref:tail protein X n=1 Tax=Erythrobacter sp. EC-HK427 TaxID=2038396 RepID=UPI0012512EEE|nr:tail protein X [Erythrobacter sp. EC-HK427]VVT07451.1 Phage tail completion protein [Erythrobacter sp. EC-HK427]
MIATAQQGETIDAICWRVLGRTAGVTERALASNPGLGDLGAQLPGGTQVDLTEAAAEAQQAARRQTVKLWD